MAFTSKAFKDASFINIDYDIQAGPASYVTEEPDFKDKIKSKSYGIKYRPCFAGFGHGLRRKSLMNTSTNATTPGPGSYIKSSFIEKERKEPKAAFGSAAKRKMGSDLPQDTPAPGAYFTEMSSLKVKKKQLIQGKVSHHDSCESYDFALASNNQSICDREAQSRNGISSYGGKTIRLGKTHVRRNSAPILNKSNAAIDYIRNLSLVSREQKRKSFDKEIYKSMFNPPAIPTKEQSFGFRATDDGVLIKLNPPKSYHTGVKEDTVGPGKYHYDAKLLDKFSSTIFPSANIKFDQVGTRKNTPQGKIRNIALGPNMYGQIELRKSVHNKEENKLTSTGRDKWIEQPADNPGPSQYCLEKSWIEMEHRKNEGDVFEDHLCRSHILPQNVAYAHLNSQLLPPQQSAAFKSSSKRTSFTRVTGMDEISPGMYNPKPTYEIKHRSFVPCFGSTSPRFGQKVNYKIERTRESGELESLESGQKIYSGRDNDMPNSDKSSEDTYQGPRREEYEKKIVEITKDPRTSYLPTNLIQDSEEDIVTAAKGARYATGREYLDINSHVHSQQSITSRPGPGTYNIDKYSFSRPRPQIRLVPGDYCSFGAAERDCMRPAPPYSDEPGPGAYHKEDSLVKSASVMVDKDSDFEGWLGFGSSESRFKLPTHMIDKLVGDTHTEDIYNPLAPDFDEPSESRINRVKSTEQGKTTYIGASACFGDKSKRLEVIPEKTDDPFFTHGKDVEHREEGTHPGVGAYDILNDRQPKPTPHLIDNPLYQAGSDIHETSPEKTVTKDNLFEKNGNASALPGNKSVKSKIELKTSVTELLQDYTEISERPPPEAEPEKKEETKKIIVLKVKESSMFASKSGRLGESNNVAIEDDTSLLKLDSRGALQKSSRESKATSLNSRFQTPGPGDYITEKVPHKKVVIPTSRAFVRGRLPQEKRFDYDEPKLAVERKILLANPGPGQYSTSSTLLKKTFNITYGTDCKVPQGQKGKGKRRGLDRNLTSQALSPSSLMRTQKIQRSKK